MNHKTHSVAGALAMELVLVESHAPAHWYTPVILAAAGTAAIVADIDHEHSEISYKLPLAAGVARLLKHRTVTHSLPMIVALWAVLVRIIHVALPLGIPWSSLSWAIVIGYASHPLIDLLNEEGIQLFWPLPYWVSVLPGPLAIPVNSIRESIFRGCCKALLIIVGLSYFFVSLPFYIPFFDSLAYHMLSVITFGRY